MKKPEKLEDVESVQDVISKGQVGVVFVSDEFWWGKCMDGGCKNLHVLFRRDDTEIYEVAATFSCEQLEVLLATAQLIRTRH